MNTSVHALTESEYIQTLLNNHAFFEKEWINLEIKKIEMVGDKANYSNWNWEVSGELGRIEKKLTKDTNYTYTRLSNKTTKKLSTDLTKKFFSSGSEINFSYDKSWPIKDEVKHKNQAYYSDVNTSEYLDDVKLSWTLPLLKNRGGVVDQKTYDLAVLDYQDEILVLMEVKEDFIEEKLMIFFDWVNYKAQIKIVKNRLILSQQILNTLQKSTSSKSNILTFERSIDKTRRLLLSLQSKLKANQKALSILVEQVVLEENLPIIDWDAQPVLIQDLRAYCRQFVRDITRIEIEQEKNKRTIETYQNSQLGDFDFTISISKDLNKGNYSSYSKSNEIEYEVKFDFSYPLTGDVANQVYLDKNRLIQRQLELKYKAKFDDILADAEKLTIELVQGAEQLSLYKKQIAASEAQKFNNELDLFLEEGGNIRFVINEQDDSQELLLGYIQTAVDYQKNRIHYDGLLDRLLANFE
jgi:hypothetical protein